jgi:hypothetical protein
MNRKTLETLVDAYAEARVSRNQHLIHTMVAQLKQAMDELFSDDSVKESEF